MQAFNWIFALKTTFNYIQSCKKRRLKQCEIMAAIKNNNLQLKITILIEKVKVNCLYIQPNN